MDKLRGAFKSMTIWVNGVFLAAMPFADQIAQGLHDSLPDIAQYIPDNIYKAVGIAIVLFNLYQRTRTTKSLEEKGQQ